MSNFDISYDQLTNALYCPKCGVNETIQSGGLFKDDSSETNSPLKLSGMNQECDICHSNLNFLSAMVNKSQFEKLKPKKLVKKEKPTVDTEEGSPVRSRDGVPQIESVEAGYFPLSSFSPNEYLKFVEIIEKLGKLRDKNILSEEEFQAEKERIMRERGK